jgi:hypothetical protein
VQIPELMTGGKRGDEQLRRIPSRRIAAEHWVGRAGYGCFALRADLVRTRIGAKLRTSKCFPICPRKRTSDLRVNEYTSQYRLEGRLTEFFRTCSTARRDEGEFTPRNGAPPLPSSSRRPA